MPRHVCSRPGPVIGLDIGHLDSIWGFLKRLNGLRCQHRVPNSIYPLFPVPVYRRSISFTIDLSPSFFFKLAYSPRPSLRDFPHRIPTSCPFNRETAGSAPRCDGAMDSSGQDIVGGPCDWTGPSLPCQQLDLWDGPGWPLEVVTFPRAVTTPLLSRAHVLLLWSSSSHVPRLSAAPLTPPSS